MMNNTIHVINFQPRRWNTPVSLTKYLLSQTGEFLTTENGLKITI